MHCDGRDGVLMVAKLAACINERVGIEIRRRAGCAGSS